MDLLGQFFRLDFFVLLCDVVVPLGQDTILLPLLLTVHVGQNGPDCGRDGEVSYGKLIAHNVLLVLQVLVEMGQELLGVLGDSLDVYFLPVEVHVEGDRAGVEVALCQI